MSPAETRQRLAERQADLVRALAGQGPVPDGFDRQRMEAAGRSLLRKRLRVVADVWPSLASGLGDEFEALFTVYARAHPLAAHGAGLTDGRTFAQYLDERDQLPDEGRLAAAAFDLGHSLTPDGLLRPRRIGLRIVRMRQQRCWWLAVRLPWLGQRWLRLPW